jgi:ubiquinone/menaquinone biosynthesis C-methylase UbiE
MHSTIQKRYSQSSVQSDALSCGANVEHLKIKSGETVLDLGCGGGAETILAARTAGPAGLAVGLDLTPSMVELAKKNAKKAGVFNAEFITGDIENLPFADEMFDAVISNCVINHAKNKEKVYREIMRVLKSGGRFVVSDAVTKYPLPPEVKNDPEAWAQCFGGSITKEEYFASIRAAGFSRVDLVNSREYIKNGYDFLSLTIKATKGLQKEVK